LCVDEQTVRTSRSRWTETGRVSGGTELHSGGPLTATVSLLLAAVREIEPVVRAHGAEAEKQRRLPDAVANAMRERGLYRLWRPKAYGRLDVDPMMAFQVLTRTCHESTAQPDEIYNSRAAPICLARGFPGRGSRSSTAIPIRSSRARFSRLAERSRGPAETATSCKERSGWEVLHSPNSHMGCGHLAFRSLVVSA
jgi:hypothetical protein